ncbi:MAG TPA: multicopper oxidase domain-containing protein, partial [Propionibacteriaceae bacterium]
LPDRWSRAVGERVGRMRTRALVIPSAVVGLVVFIIMAVVIGVGPTLRPPTAAGAAPSSPSPNPAGKPANESVPTTFKTEQRRPFQAPIELQSENGALRTAFTVEPTTFPVAGAMIKGYAYQGQYIGPTLRVHPGDTVRIDLTNRLGQPTNLHGHGMFMSPIGISDNVLRVMKSKTFNHVVWKLPSDIEPGTYWYHSHLHGLVEEQIFAGLSGVLIVDGLEGLLPPALQSVQQHVVALKDLQVKDGAIVRSNIDSNAPTTRTVNGQVDPVLTVRTNETHMLRLANIGADIWYRLRLSGTQFSVIAEDANPVAQVWTADELVLPPGKRFDVLVRWPQPGSQMLETLPYTTGPDGDNYPQRRLMTLQVSGDPVPDVAWPTSMAPPSPLASDHVDRTRHLEFSENTKTNQFYINGKQFDATHVNFVAKLGTTEEWIIRNVSREEHPFHIHVNDFMVMSVNGKPVQSYGEQDTVPLPWHGEVRIRMHFNRFTGATVFHCHIVAHEDSGMMGIIDITKDGRLSKQTQRTLDKMNQEMAGQHMHMGGH